MLAIGEVLWDLLPDGPTLGGAPMNVAAHLRRLGRPSAILTGVGVDELGRAARRAIGKLGIRTTWIQTSANHPTGIAEVKLDNGSATFTIPRPAAFDDLSLEQGALSEIVMASPVAIVIGTLAQQCPQTRAATNAVLDACPSALLLYDVNLRDGWDDALVDGLLSISTVIKMSESEAGEIARIRGLSMQDLQRFMRDLARQTGARAVCVTLGAEGGVLLLDDQMVRGFAPAVTSKDTVGAGDAFAAALLDGLLAYDAPGPTLRRAIALGALVSSRRGATPSWDSSDLEAVIELTPPPGRPTGGRWVGNAPPVE